jgi:hypothetical protein
MGKLKQYLLNWALLLDEFGNTLTGGDPGETISSRAGKGELEGKRWACILCRFLDLFQKDHCLKSIDSDDGTRAVIKD